MPSNSFAQCGPIECAADPEGYWIAKVPAVIGYSGEDQLEGESLVSNPRPYVAPGRAGRRSLRHGRRQRPGPDADNPPSSSPLMERYAAALRWGNVRGPGGALHVPTASSCARICRRRPATDALRAAYRQVFATLKVDLPSRSRRPRCRATWPGCAATKGAHQDPGKRCRADEAVQPLVVFRRKAAGWKIRCYLYGSNRERGRRSKTMSDERYTVILGDRRYAIHRKWAKLPAGESFGFLSDLMVDGEGRVHVAQRGTDRPVLVFDRDGQLGRQLGRGRAGRAALHQCRAPTARSWWPTATPIRCCASTGTASWCRRWASAIGPRSTRRSTIRRRRRRRPTARSTSPTATAIPASIASPPTAALIAHLGRTRARAGRLHHAARHLRRPLRQGAGRRSREQPRPGVRSRRHLPRRMGRLLSSDADLDRRPRPGVRDRPDPAHQPAHARRQADRPLPRRHQRRARPVAATPRATSISAELPPQEITKLERFT